MKGVSCRTTREALACLGVVQCCVQCDAVLLLGLDVAVVVWIGQPFASGLSPLALT